MTTGYRTLRLSLLMVCTKKRNTQFGQQCLLDALISGIKDSQDMEGEEFLYAISGGYLRISGTIWGLRERGFPLKGLTTTETTNQEIADGATRIDQANNTKQNLILTAFGETKTAINWSRDERCAVSYSCLRERIKAAILPTEIALTKPSIR